MKSSIVLSFMVGFLFSLGLGLSSMTNPQKIIGFLDVLGNWDPTLGFVMFGAIMVHLPAYSLRKKMTSPILKRQFDLPQKNNITPSLIIGSTLFGTGWGLAGFCPAPALVSLFSFQWSSFVFVIAMLSGFLIFSKIKGT